MTRSARITLIALVLGVILFAVARNLFEYANLNSVALLIVLLSLLLAIIVELLIAHLTGRAHEQLKAPATRVRPKPRIGGRGKR